MIKQNILFVLSLYFNYLKILKKHKMTIVNIFLYSINIIKPYNFKINILFIKVYNLYDLPNEKKIAY